MTTMAMPKNFFIFINSSIITTISGKYTDLL